MRVGLTLIGLFLSWAGILGGAFFGPFWIRSVGPGILIALAALLVALWWPDTRRCGSGPDGDCGYGCSHDDDESDPFHGLTLHFPRRNTHQRADDRSGALAYLDRPRSDRNPFGDSDNGHRNCYSDRDGDGSSGTRNGRDDGGPR